MFKGIRTLLYLLVIAALLACMSVATAEVVSLPEQLTVIEEHTFYGASSVTTAVLPEGVLEIQDAAFAYSGLEQINLPASVRYIADNAFDHTPLKKVLAVWGSYAYNWAVEHGYLRASTNPSLFTYSAPSGDNVYITGFAAGESYPEKIVLPERSPDGYLITGISSSAFEGRTGLTSVEIPGNIQYIGSRAFINCTELVNLTLNEGLVTIGGTVNYVNGAFANCVKLESVTIPASVQAIENRAFYGCSGLTTVTFRNSNEVTMRIGAETFRGTNLSDTLTIPSKVVSIGGAAFTGTPIAELNVQAGSNATTIGESAFEACRSLTTVTLQGNVQTIQARAFIDCTELVDLTLNEGLVTIGGTANYVNGAFANCAKLESVVIPASVQTIDNCAFYVCSSLTSLTIRNSDTVTMSIGREAFRGTNLSDTLTIPSKVGSIGGYAFAGTPIAQLEIQAGTALSVIGEGAFEGCAKLISADIPANVQTIQARAFINCVELANLYLSEGLVTIGGTVNYVNGAFAHCTSLKNVTIPSTVKTIDNCAFYGCSSLAILNIKNSADVQVSIGREAFRGTSLANTLTLPSKVSGIGGYAFAGTPITKLVLENSDYLTAIGEGAFEGCVNLTETNIPGNVQTIHARAFHSCKALVDLTLNEGLVTIGGTVNYDNGAFAYCTSLETLTIPSTVRTIDNAAFYKCAGLTTLTIRNSSEAAMSIGREAFRGTGLSGQLTIPSKVSGIGGGAFADTPITKLVLESSEHLTAIGNSAFENCVSLVSAYLPGNVQTIHYRAFYGCVNLDDLTLSEGLVTIGGTVNYVNGAFAYCTQLEGVVIPSTVQLIDNRAFYGCSSLISLTIRDSAECQLVIGGEAFGGTSLAGDLIIPAKVSGIGGGSFAGTKIDKLFIKEGAYLTSIGESAFEGCRNLSVVEIPGNVQTIRARAFIDCTELEKLTLNEGLVTIGGQVNYVNGAFANCTSLERVVFPSTIKWIDNRAFYNCTSLKEMLFKCLPGEVGFGTEAFFNCPGIPEYVE